MAREVNSFVSTSDKIIDRAYKETKLWFQANYLVLIDTKTQQARFTLMISRM